MSACRLLPAIRLPPALRPLAPVFVLAVPASALFLPFFLGRRLPTRPAKRSRHIHFLLFRVGISTHYNTVRLLGDALFDLHGPPGLCRGHDQELGGPVP